MGNSIKKEYDRLSITKDIAERQNIIRQFQITGFLDRNDAIKKIESIQVTDAELALATIVKQQARGDMVKTKVFFILPSELFCNFRKKAAGDENAEEYIMVCEL